MKFSFLSFSFTKLHVGHSIYIRSFLIHSIIFFVFYELFQSLIIVRMVTRISPVLFPATVLFCHRPCLAFEDSKIFNTDDAAFPLFASVKIELKKLVSSSVSLPFASLFIFVENLKLGVLKDRL